MTDRKKRSGNYPNEQIKSSKFLPKTFQTPTNKKWLDSTLDQMISKGSLVPYEGYIGSKHGFYNNDDTYISTKNNVQLSPGILTKGNDKKINNTVMLDDIVSGVSKNFEKYNYNSAYSSQPYVYNPPINIDKFVNFNNYYWVDNMPVYEAENISTSINILQEITGKTTYRFTDNNNTFDLQNGMLIKFIGNWGDAADNTYIVTGVGSNIVLRIIYENGNIRWTNRFRNYSVTDGYWDNNIVYSVAHNPNSIYSGQSSIDMITAYNNDTSANKPIFFDGFNMIRHESNNNMLVEDAYVRFPDSNDVYHLVVNNDNIQATVVTNFENFGLSFDTQDWDASPYHKSEQDYLVIETCDSRQTAWSRNNLWVHVDCIRQVKELVPSMNFDKIVNKYNKATRPIIEFESDMNMWNGQEYASNTKWHGIIDYLIDPTDQFIVSSNLDINVDFDQNMPVGTIVAFTDVYTTHTYVKTGLGVFSEHLEINNEDTALVINTFPNKDNNFVNSDVVFRNNQVIATQHKNTINQAPLFNLYTKYGIPVSNYDASFNGSKVFGYKLGAGQIDPVLNFSPSYKDSAKGAEFEFENFIFSTRYKHSITDSIDRKINFKQNLAGYYFFNQKNNYKTVYTHSDVAHGAKKHYNHVYNANEADINNHFVIPVGLRTFLPLKEYVVYKRNNKVKVLERSSTGIEIEKQTNSKNNFVVVEKNSNVNFFNLNNDNLVFKHNGVDVTTSGLMTVDNSVQEVTTLMTLNNSDTIIDVYFDNNPNEIIFSIFVTNTIVNSYHKLYVNGQLLNSASYTLLQDVINVDASVLKQDDIIDLEYYDYKLDSDSQEYSNINLLSKNSTNQLLHTFSINETIDHWKDILVNIPEFEGDAFGKNNYDKITRLNKFGGTIALYADNSIMHDIQYANSRLSITGSLVEQGKDYDAFITRFRSQVSRLYSTKNYQSVHALVQDAVNVVIGNKKGTDLYKQSNMLYTSKGFKESFTITSNETIHKIKNISNGDKNTRDHVYVWLSSDHNNDGNYFTKMLTPEIDYTVTGNKITLLSTPINGPDNKYPVLEVKYHQMDEANFVPQSIVKLGLSNVMQPQVVNNVLYTHDGFEYELHENAELFNLNSAMFDPVNAAQFELEKMIYCGLVKSDSLYDDSTLSRYTSADMFTPGQHKQTWYNLDIINNYLYTYYSKWARQRNLPTMLEEVLVPDTEGWNWNYKDFGTTILGDYNLAGSNLPGHYVGIYKILFGTSTPHLTPWHMLGFAFKPTWWDTHYSWTDLTKRASLINAIRNGIVSEPGTNLTQDPKYARYAWDWTNKCPVNNTGMLEYPKDILLTPGSTPPGSIIGKPFVFGDFGPTEQKFRNSNLAKFVEIDAICKLNPAKAYTEFFQPGEQQLDTNTSFVINNVSCTAINPGNFKIPGKIYNNTLTNIEVVNTHQYPLNSYMYVYGSDFYEVVEPKLYFDNNDVECIALNNRLDNIDLEAVVKSNNLDDRIELLYTYEKIPHVANGISQAQYNYTIRNNQDTDLENVYATLDTQVMHKANGFTRKESVEFIAESSQTGSFSIGSNDYDIVMHSGYPTKIETASIVNITRVPEGYKLSGLSNTKQEFKFYEPDLSTSKPYVEIDINGVLVKKYTKFTKLPSVAEYGLVLTKVQDVYNFVRGYFAYLESRGFELKYNYEAQANIFVNWAIRSKETDTKTLALGDTISYNSSTGHIVEFNKIKYFDNSLLDQNGNAYENEDIVVDRTNNGVTVSTKNNNSIGSITATVIDYEHVFVFENKTSFNNVIFNKVLGIQQQRLFARGGVSDNWTGNKNAPGFIVLDNSIIQNFDSSVQETNDYYRTDITEFNKNVSNAKDISIGNIKRDWLSDLNLEHNVITKFYQGAIKEAGTNVSVDRLDRFIKGATDISMYEEYMFNNAYFGDTTRNKSTEFTIQQKNVKGNPQVFEFANNPTIPSSIFITDTDSKIVNHGTKEFNIDTFSNNKTKFLTAGEAKADEARYTSFTMEGVKDVWNSLDDYAQIPAWNETTSFVLGDIVRHKGQLYKCIVNATGLNSVSSGISETGTRTNPIFDHGSQAVIDGTTITFTKFDSIQNDIVAVGSIQNPVVRNNDTITIDNETLQFLGTTQNTVVAESPRLIGTSPNFNFSSNAGKSITINGTTVDFSNPSQTNTFMFVAGTPGDPTAIPPVPATPDTTTYSTANLNNKIVSSVTVNGTTQSSQNYTINNATNEITFVDTTGSEFVNSASIVITYEDAAVSMSSSQIVSAINSQTPSNIQASITSQNTLMIVLNSNSQSATITLSPSSTNDDLGFLNSGQTDTANLTQQFDQLTMSEIIQQINDHPRFVNIIASENNNALEITKQGAYSNLVFGNDAGSIFGFNIGLNDYPTSSTQTPVAVDMSTAVNQINTQLFNANITDITAIVSTARIKIETPRTSLNFGNTDFNARAGLPTGIENNFASTVQNSFEQSEWDVVNDKLDPLLFNIWVVDDFDYEVESVDTVKSKFNDWNLFNVQNHGLYTKSTDPDSEDGDCGICAGTATTDGNDAQVSTQQPHNLQVGDYVVLTNTTTTPVIDGIHKVTKVHPTDGRIFYIDRFIEKCGNASSVSVLRNQRFENYDQLQLAQASNDYNIVNQSLVFTSYENNIRSTNVFRFNEIRFDPVRNTKYRVMNNDIENIIVYDHDRNVQIAQLEIFDPLRGIIPGVAKKEIDVTREVDIAAYNATNDENYNVVDTNCWGEDELGKRWWDTSTVRYYDYDQGTYDYQNEYWGKVFPGSSIDIYEWTKSFVTPDQYQDLVISGTEMFGTVATGEAYTIYDPKLQENLYYYSEKIEWNNELKVEETVYYFWVKNKNTKPSNRHLTVSEVSDIIYNPTANGIAWFAAITPNSLVDQSSTNAFIVANINNYLNDTSNVLQINMVPKGINHNSWVAIARDKDVIPEYYYIGMRNNLATVDANFESLPDYKLHEYNRLGDDRRLKQTWFKNYMNARNDARVVINTLLKDINLYKDRYNSWDRTFVANNMPAKTWKWVDFVSKQRNSNLQPTYEIYNKQDLNFVDTNLHNVVRLDILSKEDMVDRSEIYEYINSNWVLTEKANSTIELQEIVCKIRGGWDNYGWDTTVWDNTETAEWWRTIIDSCRFDWFVNTDTVKFNKLFFAIVDYVMSEQTQTNWIHKSTYVKVDVAHSIDTSVKRYTRDTVNNIIGYIDTVKPFHTKVRELTDIQSSLESVNITMNDYDNKVITLEYNDLDDAFKGDVLDSGNDWTDIDGNDNGNDWTYEQSYDNGMFHQPNLTVSSNNENRQHNLYVGMDSSVKILVQTDHSTEQTITFAMLVGTSHESTIAVALRDDAMTETMADYNIDDSAIACVDLSNFADTGFAYINGEIVQYNKNNNTLVVIQRETNRTLGAYTYPSGTKIIDVTNVVYNLTSTINKLGETIHDSTSTLASELQSLSQGISL